MQKINSLRINMAKMFLKRNSKLEILCDKTLNHRSGFRGRMDDSLSRLTLGCRKTVQLT